MSNRQLVVILPCLLLLLLAEMARLVYIGGVFAGPGVAILLVPTAFVLSLMIGIAVGCEGPWIRSRNPNRKI